jgi:hypothetical protein
MEFNQALEILKTLSAGINPITGEVLPLESPFQHAEIVRALFIAVDAVRRRADASRRKAAQPENTGRRWSGDEDGRLRECYLRGFPIIELAQNLSRTPGAVVARLVRLGCVDLDKVRTGGAS